MKNISNPIIPIKQEFYDLCTNKIINWETNSNNNIDYKAIVSFCSLGFFLDEDTYFKNIKTCRPSSTYQLNENKIIEKVVNNWEWHYTPSELSFDQTLDKFATLFEKLVHSQTNGRSILLPISGGLDSRTLLVPVKDKLDLTLCSYEFEGGFKESSVGKQIAEILNVPFYFHIIPKGYLWKNLIPIRDYNRCFTDFTHPRQAAVMNNWKGLGNTLLLGHWGDVLFDSHIDHNNYSYDEQLILLKKKLLKPGGIELANDLWENWGLTGTFESYLENRLDKLYNKIKIDCPSARIRAFKSLYWAPRWTSINLSMFNTLGKLVIPYYDDEMCKFICTVPERFLKGRKIQIEYIKKYYPEVAKLQWQKYHPLNLYNYNWFHNPIYFPIRLIRKMNRLINEKVYKNNTLNQRNWELQFLGKSNIANLNKHLLSNKSFNDIIPVSLIKNYLNNFMVNPKKYSHSIGMLLTFSQFYNRQIDN